jgi:acyl dehydratase
VGFERPILHGLCTYGHALRAAMAGAADGDAERVLGFTGRFAGIVLPGDALTTRIWPTEEPDAFAVETRVGERPVLDAGVLWLRAR